jgi:hypothetical protein
MDPLTMGLIMGGGALAGGLGSAIAGSSERAQMNRNIRDAQRGIQNIRSQIPGQTQQLVGDLESAYAPYTQGAAADMGQFRSYVDQFGNLQYEQADPFAYDLQAGIQQFMDPSLDLQIRQATGALEGSAANKGKLFSSSTGKAIADRAQELSQLAWKDAMRAAMEDRGFQYGVYEGDIDRQREMIDFEAKQQQDKLSALGNLAGMGQEATMNLAGQVGDINLAQIQALNDLALAQTELGMQRPGGSIWGDLLGGAASGAGAFGSIMGGK